MRNYGVLPERAAPGLVSGLVSRVRPGLGSLDGHRGRGPGELRSGVP